MDVAKPTLLIVEDDLDKADMLNAYFRVQGYEVLTVNWGEDGVRTAQTGNPDLVILDLETVDLDEMPLFKQLKTKGKKLPVIIMTDLSAAEAKKQACVLGACRILAKSEATLGNLIKTTRQTVKK